MKIESLYITQTAVIGLSDVPLEAKENIRSAFHSIFRNQKCFTDAGFSISGAETRQEHDNLPFISNLGQLCINEKPIKFFVTYPDYEELWDYRFFGYDKDLKDERMNFLSFGLNRSFKMLAQYGGRTVASGKIFLHIYPTGYIVVHLAVYRRDAHTVEIKTEKDILDLIHETKPWLDGKWRWKSRFGCYSLRETFEHVFQNISLSLLAEGKMELRKLEWKAGVSMTADLYDEEISRAIMGGEAANCFVDFRSNWDTDVPGGILFAKKKIHYYFARCGRERASVLHSFWKINHICEFVLYKNKVYSDYLNYIQKDRNEMRELNLNKAYKFKLANMIGKDFYSSTFFQYTQVLDGYVKVLGAKYRAMYSLFSDVDGFNDRRDKLSKALEAFEKDIEAWKGKDTGLKKLLTLIWKVKDSL